MQSAADTLKGKSGFDHTEVPDLAGRTAIVTGGTGGIGFEVARALALSRARVIVLSRKAEHGEEAIAKIKGSTTSTADVEFIALDLGNLNDVKQVADHIREKEERLDLLIADAGVGVNKYDVSSDGIDRHFAVNHLGHFLLINRLLPLLRKTSRLENTPSPRIVSISSELHRTAPSSTKFTNLEEINDSSLGANALYSRSKLANLLFIKYGLFERVIKPNGDRLIAIATHPGAVHTGQQEQFKEAYGPLFGAVMKAVTVPFMRDPEQGSYSTLWAATAPEVERDLNKWQGTYIKDPGQLGKETSQASQPQLGANLWDLSETLVKEKVGQDALFPWDDKV